MRALNQNIEQTSMELISGEPKGTQHVIGVGEDKLQNVMSCD